MFTSNFDIVFFKMVMMPAGVAEPYAASPIAIRPKPRQVTPSTSLANEIASKHARSSICSELDVVKECRVHLG